MDLFEAVEYIAEDSRDAALRLYEAVD